MAVPEPDRSCQCSNTHCSACACKEEMTQEDLLCNYCRVNNNAKHCHDYRPGEFIRAPGGIPFGIYEEPAPESLLWQEVQWGPGGSTSTPFPGDMMNSNLFLERRVNWYGEVRKPPSP